MDAIEFTRNNSDLSTDRGFQLEFQCDRCGNGYKTMDVKFCPECGAAIQANKFCAKCGPKQE